MKDAETRNDYDRHACPAEAATAPRTQTSIGSARRRGIYFDARRLSGGLLDGHQSASYGSVRSLLPCADGRRHRRLSPIFRAPFLPDEPLVAVRARLAGMQRRPARAALV